MSPDEVPFPEPPWVPPSRARTKSRARSRPREPLSVERIVETAFAVMEKDGYEAVTMRRIAHELGTGPASLYAHVDNKADLDNLIMDEVAREFESPRPDPDHWRDQVKQLLRDMRTVMNDHPGVARAYLGNVPTSAETMRVADGLMAILLAGGIHPQVAAWACDLLPLFTVAIAFEEAVELQGGDGRPRAEQEADAIAMIRAFFFALPAERFPHLAAAATEMTTGDGNDRFEFGLSVLVAGLEAASASWPALAPEPVRAMIVEAAPTDGGG